MMASPASKEATSLLASMDIHPLMKPKRPPSPEEVAAAKEQAEADSRSSAK